MASLRISIFDNFLSGGKVGRSLRSSEKATLKASTRILSRVAWAVRYFAVARRRPVHKFCFKFELNFNTKSSHFAFLPLSDQTNRYCSHLMSQWIPVSVHFESCWRSASEGGCWRCWNFRTTIHWTHLAGCNLQSTTDKVIRDFLLRTPSQNSVLTLKFQNCDEFFFRLVKMKSDDELIKVFGTICSARFCAIHGVNFRTRLLSLCSNPCLYVFRQTGNNPSENASLYPCNKIFWTWLTKPMKKHPCLQ